MKWPCNAGRPAVTQMNTYRWLRACMYFFGLIHLYLPKREKVPIGQVQAEEWPIRILVAEDEYGIAKTYELALRSRGHAVRITTNGHECVSEYSGSISSRKGAFDVVILDYRMPVMDGYEAAEKILAINPSQRIIFASAYAMETLVNLVRENGLIAEILQKPFELDVLIDFVEDKVLYSKLEKLKVSIGDLKQWNPNHQQLSDLLDALLRLKDPNVVFSQLVPDVEARPEAKAPSEISESPQVEDDSKIIDAILQNALGYLGPEWFTALFYHLGRMGVPRSKIAQNPVQFNRALDGLLGGAAALVKSQILQQFESNPDLVANRKGLSEFKNQLAVSDNSRTTTAGFVQRKEPRERGGIAA